MIEEPLENAVSQLMSMGFGFSRQEAIARLQVGLPRHASSLLYISFLFFSFYQKSFCCYARSTEGMIRWRGSSVDVGGFFY
jgi:hypothetical protein